MPQGAPLKQLKSWTHCLIETKNTFSTGVLLYNHFLKCRILLTLHSSKWSGVAYKCCHIYAEGITSNCQPSTGHENKPSPQPHRSYSVFCGLEALTMYFNQFFNNYYSNFLPLSKIGILCFQTSLKKTFCNLVMSIQYVWRQRGTHS